MSTNGTDGALCGGSCVVDQVNVMWRVIKNDRSFLCTASNYARATLYMYYSFDLL